MASSLSIGAYTLDLVKGELSGAGPVIALTQLEALFLAHLARRKDTVVAKKTLLQDVWGYAETVKSRAVDATLVRVRAKLEPTDIDIDSFRGRGLQLSVPDVTEPPSQPTGAALFGRDDELEQLRALLTEPGLVLLWGPPGVGKSEVARSVPGIVELSAEGEQALTQELCRLLGCEPSALAAQLRESTPTLLLDEAESRSATVRDLISGWAEHTPVLLVGTRHRPCRADLRLDPLPDDAATALLARQTGLPPDRCAPFVAFTDRLPRQLGLLAEAIAFVGVEAAADLDSGGFPAMEAAVEALWADLSEDQRAILSAISVFEGSFDLLAAAHICGRTPHATLPVLEDLWGRALVQGERGVFELLAPVRTVASRQRPEETKARLENWCHWLLEDNVHGGFRWIRHLGDFERVLERGDDRIAAVVGAMLVEFTVYESDFSALRANATRDGRPRPVVLALLTLSHTMNMMNDEAQRYLGLLGETEPDDEPPEVTLVRRAARLRWVPDAEPLEPLLDGVALPLFLAFFTIACASGWRGDLATCEQLIARAELAGYAYGVRALNTWAGASARAAGDPRWVSFARNGGLESRIVAELRQDDPDAALQVAQELLTEGDLFHEPVLTGLVSILHAVAGRTDHAVRVLDSTSAGVRSLYVNLARMLLGREAAFDPGPDQWVTEWRSGTLPDPDSLSPMASDSRYAFAWVLSRIAPS